jgi:peroxiredoxin
MTIHRVLLPLLLLLLAACGATATEPARPQPVAADAITIADESQLLEEPASGRLQVGDMAPDFAYTLSDGTIRKLSDLRGQPVLINFWATWCAPCTIEMPDLEQAAHQLRDEGLVVLGVNHSEPVELIPPFAQEIGVTFPLIADPEGDIVNGFAVSNLPTTFFIAADGTIGFIQIGLMDFEFIQQRVREL